MMRETTKPDIRTVGDSHIDQVETHPAFGTINAHRVTGGATLYGSEFQHRNFVRITIHQAETHRKGAHEHIYDRASLIAVDLSEAQWASFVSTMNAQSTQCTIARRIGEDIPGIAEQPSIKAETYKAFLKYFETGRRMLRDLNEKLQSSKLSAKEKDRIRMDIDCIDYQIASNLEFTAKQFGEHMETTVQKAKIEVNAYVEQNLRRVGINAIAESPLLFVEHKAGE